MTLQPQSEFLKLLIRHGVPFVLIGGHAVSFHGHVRATEDLDIVWLRSEAAEAALLTVLREVHAAWIADEIDPATRLERLVPVSDAYVRSTHLMMLVTDHGFVDLFDYVRGYPDADVAAFFADSVRAGGLRYASLDWLRRMKRASGRSQDLADLEGLGEGPAVP